MMKFKKLFAKVCLAASLLPALALPSQVHAAVTTSAAKAVFRGNNMAGSVLLVQNGAVKTVNYGYAWFGRRVSNGASNVTYPAASLQKVVTGAMIVQLINEKKHTRQAFRQYTKISRWYPRMKNANKVRLGELLTQTSGYLARGSENNRGRVLSENSAVNWVVNKINTTKQAKRGKFYYSNANYILLVGIIRQLTGHSYAYNFNKRIVKRLGLKKTYIRKQVPKKTMQAVSYAYLWNRKYQQPASFSKSVASQLPGAANMCTTPLEYYKIMLGLQNGQILSQSDFNYLTHLKSRKTTYSGGLYLKKGGKVKVAFGSIAGEHYGTYVQLSADNRNGIVMFVNERSQTEPQVKSLAYTLLDQIQPQTFSIS